MTVNNAAVIKTRAQPAGRNASGSRTPASKKDQLIRILSAKSGATVDRISRKFGWQPHTTRAALSGLRKAGHDVTSKKPSAGKPRVYFIAADPAFSEGAPTGGNAHAG